MSKHFFGVGRGQKSYSRLSGEVLFAEWARLGSGEVFGREPCGVEVGQGSCSGTAMPRRVEKGRWPDQGGLQPSGWSVGLSAGSAGHQPREVAEQGHDGSEHYLAVWLESWQREKRQWDGSQLVAMSASRTPCSLQALGSAPAFSVPGISVSPY